MPSPPDNLTKADWRKPELQALLLAAIDDSFASLADIKTRELVDFWLQETLVGLLQTASSAYKRLIWSWENEELDLEACAARNLLEIDVWMECVTSSKENAQRLYHHWTNNVPTRAKGGLGVLQLSAKSSYGDSDLVDDAYVKVSRVASDLDRTNHFLCTYSHLSKYLHPVLCFASDLARTNEAVLILGEGSQACIRCINSLNTFLRKENLPNLETSFQARDAF